jgi:uncharacterized protein (DUF2141 family)
MRTALALAALFAAGGASAATIEVHLSNVGPKGALYVQVCTEAEAAKGCPRQQMVAPHPGQTVVSFPNVPPGRYQVSAFQDVDGNKRLTFGMSGAPEEPWGYSRDAKAVFGPPIFEDAVIEVKAAPLSVPVRLAVTH